MKVALISPHIGLYRQYICTDARVLETLCTALPVSIEVAISGPDYIYIYAKLGGFLSPLCTTGTDRPRRSLIPRTAVINIRHTHTHTHTTTHLLVRIYTRASSINSLSRAVAAVPTYLLYLHTRGHSKKLADSLVNAVYIYKRRLPLYIHTHLRRENLVHPFPS